MSKSATTKKKNYPAIFKRSICLFTANNEHLSIIECDVRHWFRRRLGKVSRRTRREVRELMKGRGIGGFHWVLSSAEQTRFPRLTRNVILIERSGDVIQKIVVLFHEIGHLICSGKKCNRRSNAALSERHADEFVLNLALKSGWQEVIQFQLQAIDCRAKGFQSRIYSDIRRTKVFRRARLSHAQQQSQVPSLARTLTPPVKC